MEDKLKNFFKQRAVAWVVLVLAVAAACFWGFYRKDSFESRKKTELLNVRQTNWVCDEANLLTAETEKFIKTTDSDWISKYNCIVAVATLPRLNGWDNVEDYARELGQKWKIGENGILLLFIKEGMWYLAAGSGISPYLDEETNTDINYAVSELYYSGDSDGAVRKLFEKLETALEGSVIGSPDSEDFDIEAWITSMLPRSCRNISIGKIILWAFIIFIIVSAAKGSGKKHYHGSERPRPVPNTARVDRKRYSSPLKVRFSSSSNNGRPAGGMRAND
ncbi:MAG: TPM domain-containing protein [Clostridia bacterium]|nr:TPM domain-containing protein [Clostridia bacterium]